jgi:hypothetical protein
MRIILCEQTPRTYILGREGDFIFKGKHKVPPSYSRARENARSLNGCRDDEL